MAGFLTLDQINNKLDSIKGDQGGTPYEIRLSNLDSQLKSLKQMVVDGDVRVADYYRMARNFLQTRQNVENNTPGSQRPTTTAGKQNVQKLNDSITAVYDLDKNGQMVPHFPLTRTQYLSLPKEMLPSQADVSAGIIPPDVLPDNKTIESVNAADTAAANPAPVVAPAVQNPADQVTRLTPPGTQAPAPVQQPVQDPTQQAVQQPIIPQQPEVGPTVQPPVDLANILAGTQNQTPASPQVDPNAVVPNTPASSSGIPLAPGSNGLTRADLEQFFSDKLPGLLLQGQTQTQDPGTVAPPPVAPSLDQERLNNQAAQDKANYLTALNQSNDVKENAVNQLGQVYSNMEPANRASLAEILAGNQGALDKSRDVQNQGIASLAQSYGAITPQARAALDEAMGVRKQGEADLAKSLSAEEDRKFQNLTPSVLEDLNSRGLLSSSDLGNQLAIQRKNLAGDTSAKLAELGYGDIGFQSQGLTDIASNQARLAEALANQGYGVSQDYSQGLLKNADINTQGLSEIANQRNSLQQQLADQQNSVSTDYANALMVPDQNTQNLQQAGLQREFSIADYNKQADLARQIGATSVPNSPSSGFSLTGALTGGAGGAAAAAPLFAANPVLGGSIAALGAVAGGNKGSNCYICHFLEEKGFATMREVNRVHKKMVRSFFKHPFDFMRYYSLSKIFIEKMKDMDFDWAALKPVIIDDILNSKDSEEAYKKFYSVCEKLFTTYIPEETAEPLLLTWDNGQV